MATSTKSRSNQNTGSSNSSYSVPSSVDMGDDAKSDSLFLLVIAVLLVIILLFLPLLAWMYVDLKMMEIRVNKALVRIEGK